MAACGGMLINPNGAAAIDAGSSGLLSFLLIGFSSLYFYNCPGATVAKLCAPEHCWDDWMITRPPLFSYVNYLSFISVFPLFIPLTLP